MIFDFRISNVQSAPGCQCTHCKLGISVEQRKKVFHEFYFEAMMAASKDLSGLILNIAKENIEEVILGLTSMILNFDNKDHLGNDISDYNFYRTFILNKCFSIFETPVDYLIGMDKLSKLSGTLISAIQADSDHPSVAIATSVLKGADYYNYVMTGNLPDSVMKVINNSNFTNLQSPAIVN